MSKWHVRVEAVLAVVVQRGADGASALEVAKATKLDAFTARRALGDLVASNALARRDDRWFAPEVLTVPAVGLVRGHGERRECARYEACLDAFTRSLGLLAEVDPPARCPAGCPGFAPLSSLDRLARFVPTRESASAKGAPLDRSTFLDAEPDEDDDE